MIIDGVWQPDKVQTAEEQDAVAAIVDALVDQGFISLGDYQNERFGWRILRNLTQAGFVIRRR